MANTLLHKRTANTGGAPTTAQLALGEISLNTRDGKLFFKKDVVGTQSIVTVPGDALSAADNLAGLANAGTARSNLGLGSLATQADTAVDINGGAIDGTVIGGSAPAVGAFTSLSASWTLQVDAGNSSTFGLYQRGTDVAGAAQISVFTKSANGGDYLGSATAKGWLFLGRSDANNLSQQNFLIWSFWDGTTWNEWFRLQPSGLLTAAGGIQTSSLTLTGAQSAKTVLAAPNGAAGAPSFRQLASTDIAGLGTMATQAASSVAVTGGAIDGTPVGATTASTLRGTTLTLTTSQTAKQVLAAPNGANGAPSFRQLQRSDLSDPLSQKSITISSPTASEKIPLFYTTVALTVAQIRSLVLGTTPSVTFSVRYGTDVSAAGTEVVTGGTACTNTTTGLSTTTFNSASVPANSWVWVTTSATSGTVNAFHVTVVFA